MPRHLERSVGQGGRAAASLRSPTPRDRSWSSRVPRSWPWPDDANRSRRPVDARKASGDSRIGGIRASELPFFGLARGNRYFVAAYRDARAVETKPEIE